MQHIFLFFSFLSPNKGKTSFVWAPISPLRPFCASLWLGSKHIMGVRGVKSFVVVIMGSPLLSNHELLKKHLPLSPQQCQLTSMVLWEVAGKRPTTRVGAKPEWAQSCALVEAYGMEFWMRSQQPSREERKMFQKNVVVVSGRSDTCKKTREENYGWNKRHKVPATNRFDGGRKMQEKNLHLMTRLSLSNKCAIWCVSLRSKKGEKTRSHVYMIKPFCVRIFKLQFIIHNVFSENLAFFLAHHQRGLCPTVNNSTPFSHPLSSHHPLSHPRPPTFQFIRVTFKLHTACWKSLSASLQPTLAAAHALLCQQMATKAILRVTFPHLLVTYITLNSEFQVGNLEKRRLHPQPAIQSDWPVQQENMPVKMCCTDRKIMLMPHTKHQIIMQTRIFISCSCYQCWHNQWSGLSSFWVFLPEVSSPSAFHVQGRKTPEWQPVLTQADLE